MDVISMITKKRIPQLRHQLGDSSFLLYWQSTQLCFVALIATVKPFADNVTNNTRYDSSDNGC
jgi:hypothetical protein